MARNITDIFLAIRERGNNINSRQLLKYTLRLGLHDIFVPCISRPRQIEIYRPLDVTIKLLIRSIVLPCHYYYCYAIISRATRQL